MSPESCNPKLATRALQNGLQNAGLAKALRIKPRLMPINAYVALRPAKPAGLTRVAPAAEDFRHGAHGGRERVRIRGAAADGSDRPGASRSDQAHARCER
jgi:hypothetical protein